MLYIFYRSALSSTSAHSFSRSAVDPLAEMIGGGPVCRSPTGRVVVEHHLHGLTSAAALRREVEAGVHQLTQLRMGYHEQRSLAGAVTGELMATQRRDEHRSAKLLPRDGWLGLAGLVSHVRESLIETLYVSGELDE